MWLTPGCLYGCSLEAVPCRKAWWKLRAPKPGGLLVCGPAGSGKSALTGALGALLAGHPDCQAHFVQVNCQEIETDTLNNALEQLEAKVSIQLLPGHSGRSL